MMRAALRRAAPRRATVAFAAVLALALAPRTHGASFSYAGCFKNVDGSQRISGHIYNTPFSGCAAGAAQASTPYFGMEYPQGSGVPGAAACLLLGALPPQSKVADSECAAEKDAAGNLLGGGNRVAVYASGAAGFAELAGACRTANGGHGIHTVYKNEAHVDCFKRCMHTPSCLAYEYDIVTDSDHCEIHTGLITTSTGSQHLNTRCFVKGTGMQQVANANTGECAASKINCADPPVPLLVRGVEWLERGVDILLLGDSKILDSLKAQVMVQSGDADDFNARLKSSNAKAAELGRGAEEATDSVSYLVNADAEKESDTTKIKSVDELVTRRTESLVVGASGVTPKGLSGSVGSSSNEVKNSKSTFTTDSNVYYTTASVALYKIMLEERAKVQNFADEVAKLPAACPANETDATIAFDAFVGKFGTHFITGVNMGGSFTITSTHSYDTCSTLVNTQVEKCVEAEMSHVVGDLTGKKREAQTSYCDMLNSTQSSSTNTETLSHRAYFVGGKDPFKYVNLDDFCYKSWYEDVSTTPGPIKYTLDNIEHAVVGEDAGSGAKAACVKAAVKRHILKQYSAVDGAKTKTHDNPCGIPNESAVVSGGGLFVLVVATGVVVASL